MERGRVGIISFTIFYHFSCDILRYLPSYLPIWNVGGWASHILQYLAFSRDLLPTTLFTSAYPIPGLDKEHGRAGI